MKLPALTREAFRADFSTIVGGAGFVAATGFLLIGKIGVEVYGVIAASCFVCMGVQQKQPDTSNQPPPKE